MSDVPSALQRLTKARQQITCAMEETTDQALIEDLREAQALVSVIMEDLTGCPVHSFGKFDSRCCCNKT